MDEKEQKIIDLFGISTQRKDGQNAEMPFSRSTKHSALEFP